MEGHRVRRQRSSTTKTKQPEPLERIQPNAAGIDCGSRHHHVAVPVDRDPEPVRRFKTFTPDLNRMVDWGVPAASTPWRWRPPACTGSRSTTSSNSEASRWCSSTLVT